MKGASINSMDHSIALQLSKHFAVQLTPDVVDWIDHQSSRLGGTRFNQPIDAAELLDIGSSAIWGGQMLPDTLPIL
jgi:hypothetical protein